MQPTASNQFFSFKNPLLLLILAQCFFIILGKTYLDFSVLWIDILAVLAMAIISEIGFSKLSKSPTRFPGSAITAALGISIFFRASSPWYFCFAGFIAIASKYLIKKSKDSHIFNPSNFAILLSSFLFYPKGYIALSEWGQNPYIFLILAAIALFVAYRAKVLYATFSFLAFYSILFIALFPWFNNLISHVGLLSPSLILLACFMITDPKTMPQGNSARIMHGVSVALIYFTLKMMFATHDIFLPTLTDFILKVIFVTYDIFLATFLITILNLCSEFITKKFIRPDSRYIKTKNTLTLVFVSITFIVFVTQAAISHKNNNQDLNFQFNYLLFKY